MSTLSGRQYLLIIVLQYLILMFDIFINSFANFVKGRTIDLLVLYVIQDFSLIVALTILLVNFFSTYIFQAGLIQLLYNRFRTTLVLCILYVILSISLHTWHVTCRWSSTCDLKWTIGFHSLYSVHRGVAVLYYYSYKRTTLRIGDPRFYEGSSWLEKQLNHA